MLHPSDVISESLLFDIFKADDATTFHRLLDEATTGQQVIDLVYRLPGNRLTAGRAVTVNAVLKYLRTEVSILLGSKPYAKFSLIEKKKNDFNNIFSKPENLSRLNLPKLKEVLKKHLISFLSLRFSPSSAETPSENSSDVGSLLNTIAFLGFILTDGMAQGMLGEAHEQVLAGRNKSLPLYSLLLITDGQTNRFTSARLPGDQRQVGGSSITAASISPDASSTATESGYAKKKRRSEAVVMRRCLELATIGSSLSSASLPSIASKDAYNLARTEHVQLSHLRDQVETLRAQITDPIFTTLYSPEEQQELIAKYKKLVLFIAGV